VLHSTEKLLPCCLGAHFLAGCQAFVSIKKISQRGRGWLVGWWSDAILGAMGGLYGWFGWVG